MASTTLQNAKTSKEDEFYTQLYDIEQELRHYKKHFAGKVVLCNCDDPYESNFFKYFALNFRALGLKKLIATCYATSPVVCQQLSLFDVETIEYIIEDGKKPYKIEITEVEDTNGDGSINLADVEYLIKNKKNVLSLLSGDGDFRSEECIELLKEADIVVTNPPFSLFREYVAQLIEYNKKFLIIGNKNAITYKELFPLLMENKMWLGHRNINADMWFVVPENYKYEKIVDGQKVKHIMGCWFTNLDHIRRHEELDMYRKYYGNETDFPKYDNYDAINIDAVKEIPEDYAGVMGVPITFLDKFNPEQFEILGLSQKVGFGLESNKFYDEYKEIRQNGTFTGSSGKKTNGNPVLAGIPQKGNYYTNGEKCVYSLYARIFIRNKKPKIKR